MARRTEAPVPAHVLTAMPTADYYAECRDVKRSATTQSW